MEGSPGSNAIVGLKIAAFVVVAFVAWKVLAFVSGIFWIVLKLALVAAVFAGVGALVVRKHRRRGLPGGWRYLP